MHEAPGRDEQDHDDDETHDFASQYGAEESLCALEVQALLRPQVGLAEIVSRVVRLLEMDQNDEDIEVLRRVAGNRSNRLPVFKTTQRQASHLDMAMTLWRQHTFSLEFDIHACVGVDASDIKRRHFLLSRFECVKLPKTMSLSEKLNCEWSKYYERWSLPMGSLGIGEASFPHKLCVFSHQVAMASGPHQQRFRECCLGVMTDQAGTERQFGNCGAIHDPKNAEAMIALAEAPRGRTTRDGYYFPYAMPSADPMHIIWNACERVITELEMWPQYEEQLRGCLAFLGHPGRRQKWMQQANLSAFERSRFHSWQHRLVDWKWQYMARMWSRFSPGALILLERLDIAEIRKPISERDGRVTAFDPQALAGIEAAQKDKDLFLALSEAFRCFTKAVNAFHMWLTGCACHDYIWSSNVSLQQKAQMLFDDTGCRSCWRRGRRGSELARGYIQTVIQSVRQCESQLFQFRLSVLPVEHRDKVLHVMAHMKNCWIEEIKSFRSSP